MKNSFCFLFLFLFSTFISNAQEKASFTQEEVIYARKHGMALTMVVLKPEKSNGKGIVNVMSGSWYSRYAFIEKGITRSKPFLESGYTIFLTLHRSNPRFDIAEGATDVKHAVQHIRYNAKKFDIDPDNIGITGSSSGGHLSLLVSTANDLKSSESKNPVRRVSSKVQAVAVFYPPTDFFKLGTTKWISKLFTIYCWTRKKSYFRRIEISNIRRCKYNLHTNKRFNNTKKNIHFCFSSSIGHFR